MGRLRCRTRRPRIVPAQGQCRARLLVRMQRVRQGAAHLDVPTPCLPICSDKSPCTLVGVRWPRVCGLQELLTMADGSIVFLVENYTCNDAYIAARGEPGASGPLACLWCCRGVGRQEYRCARNFLCGRTTGLQRKG